MQQKHTPRFVAALASRLFAIGLVILIAACAGRQPAEEPPQAERVGLVEATDLVRAWIQEEKPATAKSLEAPLVELTTDGMWRRLGMQLFQVTGDSSWALSSFVVFGGRAHFLSTGFGGNGIMSACVTDLDNDGAPELTYTYSWGSGRHRSRIAVAHVDGEELMIEELDMAFQGDLFVAKESDTRVLVEIGRYDWRFGSWTEEAPLGMIAVEAKGRQLLPRIELAQLSAEHAAAIWK